MKIINYTNWSSEDIERIIQACATFLKTSVATANVEVRQGTYGVDYSSGVITVRLPTSETATPLQALAHNRLIGNTDFRYLIDQIVRAIRLHNGVLWHPDIQMPLGSLPDWAAELPFTKRKVNTKGWADDRIASVEIEYRKAVDELNAEQARWEARRASLENKTRNLASRLARMKKISEQPT